MKKLFQTTLVLSASLAATQVWAADIQARVISSTPVVQQVAVPRQVCNNQQVITESQKSGGGALLGAVAGGAVGNAIGNGSGRALATVIGLVGGAVVGNNIEGANQQVQNVQQCTTQTFYENRTSYYNVVYEYQGVQYNTQMANDPGQYVRLQITPVGAIGAAPQQGFAQSQDQYVQPQNYIQPAPVQQIQQYQQVYTQPQVIYQSAPVYYSQPYYVRPYYSPYYYPGVSLNFGYSRGYGHGHRH